MQIEERYVNIEIYLNLVRNGEFKKGNALKQKRQLIKQIETFNNELQYDIQAKKLFGTKSVFARIIQLCVPEFLGMDIEEVKSHILDVQVLSKEVSEGYGDGRFVRNEEERILLLSSESKVEGEKSIFFDIKTLVRNPRYKQGDLSSYGTIEIIINLEMQMDSKRLKYAIEQRGVYYTSRMISEQLGSLTEETNYGELRKVYSIWVILGEKEDKISYMRLKDQENNIVPEADLIHLILIRLSKKEYEGEEGTIFHLLHSFFDTMEVEQRKEKLNHYFDFSKEEEVEKGVRTVSSLARVMIEQAESRGISIGERRGESRGILLSARKMQEKGYSYKEIEGILGVTKEELVRFIEQES